MVVWRGWKHRRRTNSTNVCILTQGGNPWFGGSQINKTTSSEKRVGVCVYFLEKKKPYSALCLLCIIMYYADVCWWLGRGEGQVFEKGDSSSFIWLNREELGVNEGSIWANNLRWGAILLLLVGFHFPLICFAFACLSLPMMYAWLVSGRFWDKMCKYGGLNWVLISAELFRTYFFFFLLVVGVVKCIQKFTSIIVVVFIG